MAKPLVSDALWDRVEPLLPPEPPKPDGGRPRVPDRAALTGILFVLRTGIQWRMLPLEMGCGSGVTCWRRMRDWTEAGVWPALHRFVLDELGERGAIDWSRAAIDGSSIAAKKGAPMKSAPTRRIAAGPGRNTTFSSTAKASHSPSS
jgi:transposase